MLSLSKVKVNGDSSELVLVVTIKIFCHCVYYLYKFVGFQELAQELHTSRIKLMQQQKMIDECAAIESDYHALELKYDECEKNLQKLVRAKEKADEEVIRYCFDKNLAKSAITEELVRAGGK